MNLYFIAAIPQKELSDKIKLFSIDFPDRFESVKSYNSFPHIRLIPPFKNSEEKEASMLNKFAQIRLSEPAFELELTSFQYFVFKKKD